MGQEFYTRDEAASVLGVKPEELDQMRTNNEITAAEQGGAWQYRVNDVQELLRARSPSAFDDSSEFNPGNSDDFSLLSEDVGSAPQVISPESQSADLELQPETPAGQFSDSNFGSQPDMLSDSGLTPEGESEDSIFSSDPNVNPGGAADLPPATTEPYLGPDLDINFGAPAQSPAGDPEESLAVTSDLKLEELSPADDSLDFGGPPASPTGASVKLGDLPPTSGGTGNTGGSVRLGDLSPATGSGLTGGSVKLGDLSPATGRGLTGGSVKLGDLPPATGGSLKLPKNPSALKLQEDSLEFDTLPPTSQVQLGDLPAPGTGGSLKGPQLKAPTSAKAGDASDVRLDLETGSFEFAMTTDSSGRLVNAPEGSISAPPTMPLGEKPPSSPRLTPSSDEDSDVRLDFDPGASSPDDSLISIGDKPDSDVRLDPVSEIRKVEQSPPLVKDLMATEQIDLDAELAQADAASLVRRPKTAPPAQPRTKATPPKPGQSQIPGAKTQLPAPQTPTMLPTTSPFELSEEDLDLGASAGPSATGDTGPRTSPMGGGGGGAPPSVSGLGPRAGGSEFELTLAPEDEASPLRLGDDEDVDLGGAPAKGDSASHRAELSGINLTVPADSGISLEKGKAGGSDDAVDFELTLDDESATGPKTLRGKLTDSDSEFELTLDESGSSASLPKISKVSSIDATAEQKDIFETDFDLQAPGMGAGEESGSQVVPIPDEADTDLESSDFDLAIDGEEESGSQVVPLPDDSESIDAGAVPKRKSKVGKGAPQSFSEVDSMTEDELMPSEERQTSEDFDEEPVIPTVPSAQAEWGIFPLIMMVPCVLVMVMCGLMAYELVHNMWGYHQATKPSGLLVETFAKMFESDDKH